MTKEKKGTNPVVLTPENVVEQAKKGIVMTSAQKEKMKQELKEEKDAEIIRNVKERHAKISYLVGLGLVNVRRSRAYEEVALYNVRQQGRIQRFLCGFTVTEQIVNEFAKTEDNILKLEVLDEKKKVLKIKVPNEDGKGRTEKEFKVGDEVPAIISYAEFDEATEKLSNTLRDMMNEVDKTYQENVRVLEQAAGEYWNSDWKWNLKVVTPRGDLINHRLFDVRVHYLRNLNLESMFLIIQNIRNSGGIHKTKPLMVFMELVSEEDTLFCIKVELTTYNSSYKPILLDN